MTQVLREFKKARELQRSVLNPTEVDYNGINGPFPLRTDADGELRAELGPPSPPDGLIGLDAEVGEWGVEATIDSLPYSAPPYRWVKRYRKGREAVPAYRVPAGTRKTLDSLLTCKRTEFMWARRRQDAED